MHCELVVPGLLSVAAPPRLPALEVLLARGRASRAEPRTLEAWLGARFGLSTLPAGALTVLGAGHPSGDAVWMRADPVHLRLLRDRMVLVPGEALRITDAEAHSLADSLNAHFGPRLHVEVQEPLRWVARVEEPFTLPGESALGMAGIAAAPGGAADALLTEIQMALHAHPVNDAREARGEPPVNSLWLWGAGPAPLLAAAPWQSVTAADPLARGLARAAEARSRPPSPGAAWLERSPDEGRHLVVLDSLRPFVAFADAVGYAGALQALERDWFSPVLAALRTGRIGMTTLHVPDARAALSVETVRGDLRRIWRRPRPLGAWIG